MRLRDFFKVETLDHRLGSKTGGEPLKTARPPKWNTPEYYIWYLFFAIIPVLMVKSVYDVSRFTDPRYMQWGGLLRPGWIPGRMIDNSDAQYRGFRSNIPYMAVVVVLHPFARRAYQKLRGNDTQVQRSGSSLLNGGNTTAANADARLETRINFDVVFGPIFLIVLHGISSIKIFIILYVNYRIANDLPKQHVRAATWIFNIGLLFANELGRGYPMSSVANLLSGNIGAKATNARNWGHWVDSNLGGLIPRWEVLFNFSVLRLIAYNCDYVGMLERRSSSVLEKKNLDPTSLSDNDRASFGANSEDFTFRNYIAYMLYSPLYLAGPILNFNDFINQLRYPLPYTTRERIIPYALRFLLCLLTMEVVLHHLYVQAISKSNPNWSSYTPFQLSMLGYFNLHIVWLKLLLPWRFFRLWALLDGVDAPENMVRCMSDNYSSTAFWRAWHRSFNMWVTRYIYFPLGGSKVPRWRAVMNYLLVFTFVALWHDINLQLLAWAWLVVLFVLPEIIATLLFPAKDWVDRPNTYRWLCGIGAVANIFMMMAANLVGFVIGLDGLKGLVDGIVGSLGGRVFLVGACATLFAGAQVMFEIREAEKRRGIHLKY